MFTGSTSSDIIIKEAHERLNAGAIPNTFLGKIGIDMKPEVSLMLDILKQKPVTAIDCTEMITMAIGLLDKSAIAIPPSNNWRNTSGLSIAETKATITGIYQMIRIIVKQRIQHEVIHTDLQALQMKATFIDLFLTKLKLVRFKLEKSAVDKRIQQEKVCKMKWRCDYTKSSSSVYSTDGNIITIQLEMSDGTTKRFQMDNSKFHMLRYGVAQALHRMNEFECHPMMNIMDVLAEEEKRKLMG